MIPDRPLIGIVLMLGFCILAPLGDTVAKFLGGTIPLLQLMLVRMAAQAIFPLPVVIARRVSLRISKRLFYLTALRTLLHVVGIGAFFTALRYLPLADAVAIAFVLPFIMLLLGRFILKEEVGPRRLIACAFGFAGTLLVVQPSFITVGWPALLPALMAVAFAFYMLISRHIAKEADPFALQTIAGMMAIIPIGLALWLGADSGFEIFAIVKPTTLEAVLLITLGFIGTFSHLLMTWSLRYAPSATLAPIQYLEIPFATFLGWLVFQELPNTMSAFGILVIMASGFYILYRERQVAAQAARNQNS